jgi:TolB-like protein/Tfp pilus assembly protein PilF
VSFFAELKRRNVFRVGIAYVIGGWLLLQLTDVLSELLDLPDVVGRIIVLLVAIGLPITLFFAWAFELTPEGIKKEKDVDRSQSITAVTGQKLNNVIIGTLVVALGYFVVDKFVIDPGRDAEEIATAVQDAREKPPLPAESAEIDRSIAVLPFVNMSSDKEQEYFSDGLSEELLNLLAKIPELRVAARTSSFSFKDKDLEIPEIASRLKVAHILEGSVRKSGNQLRITAQLVQADNGYHLWSETYDRQLDNIFQIQDEIAVSVVDALKITLLGEAPRARETDPKAYQLYLEAQFHRRHVNPDSLKKSIDLYRQALDIDPEYSPAWAEMAYAYIWLGGVGGHMSIEEANELADQAVETALELDSENAFAYFVRGASSVFNKFNFKAGIRDYQHALLLDPGNAFLIAANATGARVLGRLDESIQQYKAALELDPIMPEVFHFLATAQLYSGDLDEAEANITKTLSLSPKVSGAYYRLGRILIRKGYYQEALAKIEQEPSGIYRFTGLAMVHHALNNNDESVLALSELIEIGTDDAAFQIAEVHGFRGETDKAFEWLERSLTIRDSGLASILGDPAIRVLRTDARWQPFLEKLGLLEFWLEMPPEHGGPVQ